MNRSSDLVYLQLVFDGDGHLVDGFTGTFSNDCGSENRAVCLRDYFDEPILIVFTSGAIHPAQIPAANGYLLTKLGAGLFLGRPDMRNLGIGKGNPRNEVCESRTVPRQEGVADRLKRLPSRKVGELITANDVARGVNVFGGRSQSIVNLDAFLRVLHTRFLEVETLQIRPSAGRDKQHLASRFLATCGDHNRFSIFAGSSGTPPYKTDPFAFENMLQQLANVRIFFGQ